MNHTGILNLSGQNDDGSCGIWLLDKYIFRDKTLEIQPVVSVHHDSLASLAKLFTPFDHLIDLTLETL